MTREEFKALIAAKFILMDEVADALYNAITLRQHIMLYGQGGHAKSELAEYAVGLFYKPEDTFILSVDRHTPQAALTGPTNVPELMRGNYTLVVQQSIMAHKAAIIEEGLDSRVISGLKDLLTRGRFCTGDVCYDMKTEFIILCTNHTPEDWAQNASDMALLRRFHYRVKVEWKKYKEENFMKMFATRFEDPERLRPIAMMAEMVRGDNPEYTPAAAIKDASAYLKYGEAGLIGSAILTQNHIKFIATATQRAQAKTKYAQISSELRDVIMEARNINNPAIYTQAIKKLNNLLTRTDELRPDSSLIVMVKQLRDNIQNTTEAFNYALKQQIQHDGPTEAIPEQPAH